jgi:hypothetical protein
LGVHRIQLAQLLVRRVAAGTRRRQAFENLDHLKTSSDFGKVHLSEVAFKMPAKSSSALIYDQ